MNHQRPYVKTRKDNMSYGEAVVCKATLEYFSGAESMSVKSWPESERPREKLQQFGVSALSDAELLAILLGSGCRGLDVVTFARAALVQFNGLAVLTSSNQQWL